MTNLSLNFLTLENLSCFKLGISQSTLFILFSYDSRSYALVITFYRLVLCLYIHENLLTISSIVLL